jgi:hypothetical protein
VTSHRRAANGTFLGLLVPPSNQVYTPTTTTMPAKDSTFTKAAALFQTCLGVTNATDRIYGAAGQQPDYQVSSPIFNANSLGGVQLASTSQYYKTTVMVAKDTHEMSKSNFGSCFAKSSAALVLAAYGAECAHERRGDELASRHFRQGMVARGCGDLARAQRHVEVATRDGRHDQGSLRGHAECDRRLLHQDRGPARERRQHLVAAHVQLERRPPPSYTLTASPKTRSQALAGSAFASRDIAR